MPYFLILAGDQLRDRDDAVVSRVTQENYGSFTLEQSRNPDKYTLVTRAIDVTVGVAEFLMEEYFKRNLMLSEDTRNDLTELIIAVKPESEIETT